MMCCSRRKRLEQKLDEALIRLESSYIREKIDGPLDRAASDFPIDEQSGPGSVSEFIRTLGCFLRHLHENGLRVHQRLGVEEAEAEAVSLLDQYYPGVPGARFDAAWIDAANGHEGLVRAADLLLSVTKQMQRRKHELWTLKQLTAPLTWSERVELTEVFLKRIRWQLPKELADANPECFVHQLPQFMRNHAQSRELRNRPASSWVFYD